MYGNFASLIWQLLWSAKATWRRRREKNGQGVDGKTNKKRTTPNRGRCAFGATSKVCVV